MPPKHTLTRLGATLAVTMLLAAAPRGARAADADPWLARDKALHAGLSCALGAGLYATASPLVAARSGRFLLGAGGALALGAAKELVDFRGGDPSGRDLAWDAVGALTGAGIALFVDWLVSRRAAPAGSAPAR